jgi:HAD superfamily hydrolase (TIGR01509 family)
MSGRPIKRPRGVVLDLDGTLVDTVETRIEAWMGAFAQEGIQPDRKFVGELIGSDGRRLAREVGRALGITVDEARAERIDARSGGAYSQLNTNPQPLTGATDFLDALDAARIPWAIATSSRREQVGVSVAALHRRSMPLVVDGSTVLRAKPDPALLLAAAAAMETDPAACWCVGDSTWDMEAARAAGMTAIAVIAGSAVTEHQLRSAGATLVMPTLGDLAFRLARHASR